METKHGSAPRDDDGRPTTWDNDAVQLCGQALLMEEAFGKPVERGFQFYAGTRERVEVRFTEELRAKTRAAIDECRRLSALDAPPDPLPAELRHRCFGCSLAPVCLPEETLYQIGLPPATEETAAPPGLTRVIPQSDDGAVLYVQEPGSHVGKRSEHLVVRKDGQEVTRVPMHAHPAAGGVRQRPGLDAGVGDAGAERDPGGVPDGPWPFHRHVCPGGEEECRPAGGAVSPLRRRRGVSVAVEGGGARQAHQPAGVVDAEPAGRRRPRQRRAGRARPGGPDPASGQCGLVGDGVGTGGPGSGVVLRRVRPVFASAAAGPRLRVHGRNRRPPRDPVNALLSFAYAMLAKDCFSAVCTVGFDPYKGFFHQNRHGKPSLALDLMEEFRPVIADSVVLTLINNEMLTPADFVVWREACQLTDSGRKTFFQAYEQRKATVVTHPVYGYKMSYSRMLEVQARMLAAYVRGSVPAYTGFTVR